MEESASYTVGLRESALAEYAKTRGANQTTMLTPERRGALEATFRGLLWSILTEIPEIAHPIHFDELPNLPTWKSADGVWFTLIERQPLLSSQLGWVENCSLCAALVIFPIDSLAALGRGFELRQARELCCPACEARRQQALEPILASEPPPPTAAQRLAEALRDFLLEYVIAGQPVPPIPTLSAPDTADTAAKETVDAPLSIP